MSQSPWWRGAVIYQVYTRSFQDSNGDGVGDLAGIAARLEYIASLNVDAIWISPFFKSPMADFGYDISDPRAVDPLFGELDDFDRLLRKAHALDLKVIIDQVLSHTSMEHPWFQESRRSRDNPRADWYVWADPKDDGTAPNNWLSIFGGPAWQWEPHRQQYYLHHFLTQQPALNFHCPEVPRAVLENVEFWLQRGVDGLRLDSINFCFHDRRLRDNPPKPAAERAGRGFTTDNPYAYQYHYYNNTRPETLAFLQRLRALLDRYPGVTTLGEISSENSPATMAEYTRPGRLHMAYSFELLTDSFSARHILTTVETLENEMAGAGWPCWAISNHDVARAVSRWGRDGYSPQLAKMLAMLVCSLRGSVCIYQGEELGLPEADLPLAARRDPYGIAFWPTFKGRDGSRTPMPWDDSGQAGFTTGQPWLPVPAEHRPLAVAHQESDPASILNSFRHFMRLRKTHPALLDGDIRFLQVAEPALAFIRQAGAESVLAVFNLADRPLRVTLPEWARVLVSISGFGAGDVRIDGAALELPAYGAWFAGTRNLRQGRAVDGTQPRAATLQRL
ncbi:MAG: alpha-glucosidase [Gammaproteobacteria bacterium]|nr:alpha-glucosidase [Gammaproteobacteria bacterium]